MEFHKDLCPENISTVRGLIDGTFKSELTTIKIGEYIFYFTSKKHLDLIVTNGKFTKTEDLVILSMLLGQTLLEQAHFLWDPTKVSTRSEIDHCPLQKILSMSNG